MPLLNIDCEGGWLKRSFRPSGAGPEAPVPAPGPPAPSLSSVQPDRSGVVSLWVGAFPPDEPEKNQRPKTRLGLPIFTLATDRASESCVVVVVMHSLRF